MDEILVKQAEGPDDAPDFIGITGKGRSGALSRVITASFRNADIAVKI